MQVQGKIHHIADVQNVTDTFKKRSFVLEVAENPTYPEFPQFEFQSDKVSILDGYKVGENVEIEFNLRGRPWTNKEGVTMYFNTLIAWRIKKLDNASAPIPAPTMGEEDDLPF